MVNPILIGYHRGSLSTKYLLQTTLYIGDVESKLDFIIDLAYKIEI